jgi:hypothetical protein
MEDLLSILNAVNLRLIHGGSVVLCLTDDKIACVRTVAVDGDKILAGLEPRAWTLLDKKIVLAPDQWDRLLSILNFG